VEVDALEVGLDVELTVVAAGLIQNFSWPAVDEAVQCGALAYITESPPADRQRDLPEWRMWNPPQSAIRSQHGTSCRRFNGKRTVRNTCAGSRSAVAGSPDARVSSPSPMTTATHHPHAHALGGKNRWSSSGIPFT